MSYKLKVVANYDVDRVIRDSVENCFIDETNFDERLTLTDGEDYDYLAILNGYRGEIKILRERVFGFMQEPVGNNNYDRNLHFYCGKVFAQNENVFGNFPFVEYTPMIMFFRNHEEVKWKEFRDYKNFDKPKKLSIVVSSVFGPNNLGWRNHNYKKRIAFVSKLLASDLDIDIYGRGWEISDPRFKGEVKYKKDALYDYEYSIGIENACEHNYASEKLFDCFMCNTIPLYYGCPNVADIYEPESVRVIDIESDNIIDDIKKIVSVDNKLSAEAVLDSKARYFQRYNLYNIMKKEILGGV
jgi:hypothetical protein